MDTHENTPATIGAMLRAVRERKALQQGEAAEALGVSTKTYGLWERGQRVPPIRYRRGLRSWLGCSLRAVGDACIAQNRLIDRGSRV